MEKETYDLRGGQGRITRLWHFYREGYIHMLFYRILIPLSIISAIVLAATYILDYAVLDAVSRLLLIAVWVVFTPQVFESAKGASVIATKGFIHGDLNKSYMESAIKYEQHPHTRVYKALPYAALSIWIAGLIAISILWLL
ncbi:hypothetical protein M1397_02265 [Candidatus Marsarchaeota archaeon]|nr:hypothetical protein [Candidatus Marsarchaeota archaeon]